MRPHCVARLLFAVTFLYVTAQAQTNVAPLARVTDSSENTVTSQLGIKAIDGIIGGFPGDSTKEWATRGQLAGAWIQLNWPIPVQVSSIVLWDRPNLMDNVQAGTLSFSDGSTAAVGQLPNDASSGYLVAFPTKTIGWVRFTVTQAVGFNTGLSEFQVFQVLSVGPQTDMIAAGATVTESSQNVSTGQLGTKAVDGVIGGFPGDPTREWATQGQLAGAWIQLNWPSAVQISRVVLWDRPNSSDNVRAGTLSFSDGSSAGVGQLANDASAGFTILFPTKVVTSVRFTITQAVGFNIGLSEFQVFGPSAIAVYAMGVTLNPSTIVGGGTSQGTVTLSGPAPAGGARYTLTSSNQGSATVPISGTVAANATSGTFTESTTANTTAQNSTITATYGGSSPTALSTISAAGGGSALTANPNANANTVKLLNYFYSLKYKPSQRVISAFQIVDNTCLNRDCPGSEQAYYAAGGNHYQAAAAVDYCNSYWDLPSQACSTVDSNAEAIRYWNAGGLVEMGYQPINPITLNRGIDLSQVDNAYVGRMLTAGTAENAKWNTEIDVVATGLQSLQTAGVVVIFRPFMEMNGNWFWWGTQLSPSSHISMWRYLFNYFTYTKGLNNLLWMWAPNDNAGIVASDYPNNGTSTNYVDIVAADVYRLIPGDPWQTYYELVATGKPVAMSEFGPGGSPAAGTYDYKNLITAIKNNYPLTTFVNQWWDQYSITQQPDGAGYMGDPWVIDRPGLSWR